MAPSLQGDMESNCWEVNYILEIDHFIPLSNYQFAKIDLGESDFVFGLRLMNYFVVDFMGMKKKVVPNYFKPPSQKQEWGF